MAVFKDCHQRLPKALLKWWLPFKTVIAHCPKFCWSDGCLWRLSSKTAHSSWSLRCKAISCLGQVSVWGIERCCRLVWLELVLRILAFTARLLLNDWHAVDPQLKNPVRVMSSEIDPKNQEIVPKVLLKWWLSSKTRENTREKTAKLQRLTREED